MTELTAFLTSLYDSVSEAEMRALRHGRTRLAELLASGEVPEDVTVPVYHASDVEVTLDVGLVAEETDEGMEVFVTEAEDADASELSFTVDLFELLEKEDLEDLGYDDVIPGPAATPTGERPESGTGEDAEPKGKREEEEEKGEKREDGDDGGGRSAPIDVVEAIDPRHGERLRAAGIEHLADLAERSPAEVAEIAAGDEEVPADRAAEWRDEARGLAAMLSEYEDELPVELVDGIGPTYGQRLREGGVTELSDLVDASAETIAELAGTEESSVSVERAAEWRDRATAELRAMERTEDT